MAGDLENRIRELQLQLREGHLAESVQHVEDRGLVLIRTNTLREVSKPNELDLVSPQLALFTTQMLMTVRTLGWTL